jgi:hypothetical protein
MPLIGVAVILALSLTLPTLAAKAQETAKKAHDGVLLLTPRAGAGAPISRRFEEGCAATSCRSGDRVRRA